MTRLRCALRSTLLRATIGVLAASQYGCAAFNYVSDRVEEIGNPLLELGVMSQPQEGLIGEMTQLDGREYVRVAVPGARQSCGRTETLELLLPRANEQQYTAILREATHKETFGPTVVLYGPKLAHPPGFSPDAWARADIRQWLISRDIPAQPISPIVIAHGPLGTRTYYRIGNTDQPRWTWTEVNIDWICRDRFKYGLLSALYIPAIAIDIVTGPVQFGVLLFGTLVGPFLPRE